MIDDANGEEEFSGNEELLLQTVFTGRGSTLEAALANAAGHALRRGVPEGTEVAISGIWGEIHNPRVSDYRVIITTPGT
jgi:hypothetical protein